MPRTLTESEFNALKAKILSEAPDGLKEDEFNRYIGPAMAQAIGTAENSTGPVVGSAASRFASGAWKILNPMGLVDAVMHPLDTVTGLASAHLEQGKKAVALAREGRYVEAAGHGAAALLPVIGPAAANAGESIAAGDVAGGLGEGAALLAPAAASAGRVPIGKATSAVGRTAEAVGKSSPMRRLGTVGAIGEVMRGDLLKAGAAAAAPVALEKGGQVLQMVGDRLAGAKVISDVAPAHLNLSQRVPAGELTQQQIGERLAAARAQGMTAPKSEPLPKIQPRAVASPEPTPVPPGPPEPSMQAEPFNAPRVKPPTPKELNEQAIAVHRSITTAAREAGVALKEGDLDALKSVVRSGVPAEEAVAALKATRVEDPAAELARRFNLPSDAERTFPPNKSGLPTKPPTATKARGKIADLADMPVTKPVPEPAPTPQGQTPEQIASQVAATKKKFSGKIADLSEMTPAVEKYAKTQELKNLSPEVDYALKWIENDMEAIPYTKRSVIDHPDKGMGGARLGVGGSAGSKIYRNIVGQEGAEISGAGRADVIKAIKNLRAGKITPVGELVLGVAKDIAGMPMAKLQKLMETLPP